MSRYYVHFYNKNNFGDDLFVDLMARTYPQHTFDIHGPRDFTEKFRTLKNVRVHYDSLATSALNLTARTFGFQGDFVQSQRANPCSEVIYIGGSLFMVPPPEEKERFYQQTRNMKIRHLPFNIAGANISDFSDEEHNAFCHEFFTDCSWISFRDELSASHFSDLKQVHVFPDIAFVLRRMAPDLPDTDSSGKKAVIVSVLGRQKVDDYPAYLMKMAGWVNTLSEKDPVILLSLCDQEGDLKTCQEILQHVRKPENIQILNYQGNIREILEAIAHAKLMIGARFHSIVAALALGTPVIPLIYADKTAEMLRLAGFKGRSYPLSVLPDPDGDLFADLKAQTLSDEQAEKMAAQALRHFDFMGGDHV